MATEANDPYIDPLELAEANRRHDRGLAAMGISWDGKVRSSWSQARLIVRRKLTDRKISLYEKDGFYSAEFREARKRRMDKLAFGRRLSGDAGISRRGNFVERDGRLIYSPSV